MKLRNTFWTPAALLVVALLIGTSSSLEAQPFTTSATHPSVAGTNIDFTGIKEVDFSATSPISLLFYGAPSANGDTLEFDADGFRAGGVNGALDFLDGEIRVRLTGRDGATFSSIQIQEGGAYNLFGARSTVSSTGSGFATTSAGTYGETFTFTQTGTGAGLWTGGVVYNFPETNAATLVFDNQLLAAPQATAGVAFIDKKFFNIIVDPTPAIPEPTSIALLGLSGLAVMTRRRRLA